MKNSKLLRKILKEKDILVLPGVYDCLSAKIAENTGFEALFTSGFCISASTYGKPDYGLVSSTEILNSIANISNSISVPLVADIDNGYGNYLNVIETIEKLKKFDIAGVILEDQQWPKRCGHMEGKKVIDTSEHVEKIRAARSTDDDLIIIARTDSRAVYGLDEAIKRGEDYLNAGADILFIEAPESYDELKVISTYFKNNYLFANMVEGGKTPILSHSDLESLGFKIIVYPLTGLFSSINALSISYNYLKSNNTSIGLDNMIDFQQFEELIDLDKFRELEKKYSN